MREGEKTIFPQYSSALALIVAGFTFGGLAFFRVLDLYPPLRFYESLLLSVIYTAPVWLFLSYILLHSLQRPSVGSWRSRPIFLVLVASIFPTLAIFWGTNGYLDRSVKELRVVPVVDTITALTPDSEEHPKYLRIAELILAALLEPNPRMNREYVRKGHIVIPFQTERELPFPLARYESISIVSKRYIGSGATINLPVRKGFFGMTWHEPATAH